MNGIKKTAIIIIVLIFVSGMSVWARGSRDSVPDPQPEPAPVKEASSVPSSAGKTDSAYPPAGWVTDIAEAYRIAQAEDKDILLNFTGSDWCVWCKRLSKEVFSTPEFKSYADEHLVLLFLDFPNTIKLPDEQVYHNQFISQILGIQGYPSIWLMDKDLNPKLVTGYQQGGAEEYIRHLEEDRPDVSDEERASFRVAFTEAIETNFGPLN